MCWTGQELVLLYAAADLDYGFGVLLCKLFPNTFAPTFL